MKIDRKVLVALVALWLGACSSDNDDASFPPMEAPADGVVTRFALENDEAKLGLVERPEGAEIDTLTGDFQGFLVDASSAQFAGFGLRLGAEATASAFRKNEAANARGSRVVAKVRDGLMGSGGLNNFSLSFERTFRSPGADRAYSAKIVLATSNSPSVSALRARILEIVNEKGDASELPQRVEDQTDEFVLELTVIETGDEALVTAGLLPREAEDTLPPALDRFQKGESLLSTEVTLASSRQQFQSSGSSAADILWVIDNSGSMGEEQQNLADGIGSFFDLVESSGLDYRLAVARTGTHFGGNVPGPCHELTPISTGERFITPATPDARTEWIGSETTAGIAQPGTSGSGNETGLFCGHEAFFVDPNGTNTGFDRPDATNIIVYVSDEPDGEVVSASTPGDAPPDYVLRDVAFYEAALIENQATAFAIVGNAQDLEAGTQDPGFFCSGAGGSAEGGAAYGRMVSATSGGRTSICANAQDWTPMFEGVALAASGGASQFVLDFDPVLASVRVAVAGMEVPRDTARRNGFDVFQSGGGSSLVFFGDARPMPGQTVEVRYDYVED